MQSLSQMLGLADVKAVMRRLRARLEVDQVERQSSGQPRVRAPNLFFAGNPGTGKTTVGRLYGSMLRDLGILSSGHVVEVRRGDLVAGFIGQTAPLTRAAIQRAKGGVLFVDEAHTLAPGDTTGQDFGKEAINEIMRAMTDEPDMAVVFATFADYSDGELAQILTRSCAAEHLHISHTMVNRVASSVGRRCGQPDFGNAGDILKVLEDAKDKRAERIAVT